MEAIVIIGAALTLISAGFIIPIILRVAKQKNEAFGFFALIPSPDIEAIIESSQKVSICDAIYDHRLIEFKEDEDMLVTKTKEAKKSANQITANPTQPPITQEPILPENENQAPGQSDIKMEDLSVEAADRAKRIHKQIHLVSGE